MICTLLLSLSLLGSPAQAIVNGSATSEHPAVAAMAFDSGGAFMTVCTATLIAPQWALTTASCAPAFDHGYPVALVFGPGITAAETSAPVVQVIVHPDYDQSSTQKDLALLELEQAVEVEPMPLNTTALDDGLVGTPLRFVGFGYHNDGSGPVGEKYEADIPVIGLFEDAVLAEDTENGASLCDGDAGGPAMEQVDGAYHALAIGSFRTDNGNATGNCAGMASGAVRVDLALDWIQQYTPITTLYDLPDDTGELDETAVPEDTGEPKDDEEGCSGCSGRRGAASAWLLLAGLGLLARRRR